uniref:Peptidase S1 domain-containing protein n=1 Tax=Cacopsylla melanoneura TaxID=428564 RepID=A0A8D8QXP8_9HEMI
MFNMYNQLYLSRHWAMISGTLLDMVSEQKTRRKRFIDFIDAMEYEKINRKILENVGQSERKMVSPSFIRRKEYNFVQRTTPNRIDNRILANRQFLGQEIKHKSHFVTEKIVRVSRMTTRTQHVTTSIPVTSTTVKENENSKYVRNVVKLRICPTYKLDADLLHQCDLALLEVDRPYIPSRGISWLPIGNGPPPETSFKVHLCGWGVRSEEEKTMLLSEKKPRTGTLVKNFVLDAEILPPAQCPPCRKGKGSRLDIDNKISGVNITRLSLSY